MSKENKSPLLIFVGKALSVAQIPNGVPVYVNSVFSVGIKNTIRSNFRKGCVVYEHVNTGQKNVLQRELRQAQDAKNTIRCLAPVLDNGVSCATMSALLTHYFFLKIYPIHFEKKKIDCFLFRTFTYFQVFF